MTGEHRRGDQPTDDGPTDPDSDIDRGSDDVDRGEQETVQEVNRALTSGGWGGTPNTRNSQQGLIPGFGPDPEDTGPPRSVARTIARTIGELLLTLGVVLLLLVVYELWITDIFSARRQSQATQVLDQKWQQADPAQAVVTKPGQVVTTGIAGSPGKVATPAQQQRNPNTRTRKYSTDLGQGFAKLYVPAFGTDFVYTVIEGVATDDLSIGPGHYAGTQYPGQPGNFAVAGHRVSHGAPFNDLGQLNSCDAIVVQTQDDWFVYRVLPMRNQVASWNPAKHDHCQGVSVQRGSYGGVFGRDIVLPSAVNETFPIPGNSSPTIPALAERLITLTTCNPQFSDAERMIIHGVLVKSYAKGAGFLPPELQEGG
ncbi:MAG: class E sortase [Actinomycetota bacterium]|nr:class E sortase [Actinomycetota bacterium]